jgi:photosystem II stability/assembly factor-like uncharacterized protein
MLAGASGGLYRSHDGGRRWQRRLRLPGGMGASFVWRQSSSKVVFAGTIATSEKGSKRVYVSHDAGVTWRAFGRGLSSNQGVMSLGITSKRLYAGTMGNAVWMAPLASGSWRQVAQGMPENNNHVAAIATVPGHSSVVFAGTLGYGVFRASDGVEQWKAVEFGSSQPASAKLVLSLSYSQIEHTIYAGTGNGVYALADG